MYMRSLEHNLLCTTSDPYIMNSVLPYLKLFAQVGKALIEGQEERRALNSEADKFTDQKLSWSIP
jgi:hypothetical protein